EDAAVGARRQQTRGDGLSIADEPQLVVVRGLGSEAPAHEERASPRVEEHHPGPLHGWRLRSTRGLERDELGARLREQLERVLLPEEVDASIRQLARTLGG